jgi:hypothetical protein
MYERKQRHVRLYGFFLEKLDYMAERVILMWVNLPLLHESSPFTSMRTYHFPSETISLPKGHACRKL